MKKLVKIVLCFLLTFVVFSNLTRDASAVMVDFSINSYDVIVGNDTSGVVDGISWRKTSENGQDVIEFGAITIGQPNQNIPLGTSFGLTVNDTGYKIVFTEDINIYAANVEFSFFNTSDIVFKGDVNIHSLVNGPLYFEPDHGVTQQIDFEGNVKVTSEGSHSAAILFNNEDPTFVNFKQSLEVYGGTHAIYTNGVLDLSVNDGFLNSDYTTIKNDDVGTDNPLSLTIKGTLNINSEYMCIDSSGSTLNINTDESCELIAASGDYGITCNDLYVSGGKVSVLANTGITAKTITLENTEVTILSDYDDPAYSSGGINGATFGGESYITMTDSTMFVHTKMPALSSYSFDLLVYGNSNLTLKSDSSATSTHTTPNLVSGTNNPLTIKSSLTNNFDDLTVIDHIDMMDLYSYKILVITSANNTDNTGDNTGGNNTGANTDNNNSGNNGNVVQTSDTTDSSITYSLLGISLLSLVLLKKKQYN